MAAAAEDLVLDPTRQQSFIQTPFGRNIALGVGAAIVVAMMVAVWLWSQQPEYRVLFSNYTDRDGGAITASLDQMAIKYKFSDGGTAILVPASQVHDVRLKLAAQGLPKGGNVGFELMENQKLGVSQFLEQVNYQRSLEGELARSIQSLAAVSAARVHLALPKPQVFVRDQQKPTASVLLNLQTGRTIDAAQVSAIVHLVASSVAELPPSNVTVVDQAGNLLSDTSKSAGAKNLDPNQLKYVAQLQQSIVKQVESLIVPLVGQGNVRAEATADVDFAQVDTAAEIYKPNSPPAASAIRSQQSSEAGAPGSTANGVPGALSNQPPGAATAPIDAGQAPPPAAPGAGAASTRKDSTTNYEVDKTIRYEQRPMGGIKRLSVGVVVNYRRLVDAKTGKVSIKALSAAEVAQINDLVKEAMGYSKERGDTLNVTNAPFDGVDKPVVPPEALVWWRDPEIQEMARQYGKYLLAGIVLLFLYYRILRPMMRPVLRRFDQITELPPAPPKPGPDAIADEAGRIEQEAETTPQVSGYRENLSMAKKLASDDPRVVANVVKAWVGSNE
ncbi:flagellar basal-body MS-ring/collar protein FliF [Massilia psychrophila]|uniref:Flagellar M-ring protein n=1 Tax=Massilia psychrophila TaxID=1603353 RepID=A0A2G8SVT9_9BURK|nr:flagellar basal-body MS-ring/collar protein FliF [Massilia psychrophila]PIL37852.1 flagellar M-ring protein FliF [Massilia psychrophila]GGE84833.1 flagellar M-ring protein [Massilia psychrophila]